MYRKILCSGVALATIVSGAAFAASNTTWVASTGVDTAACTRAAPCATFARALTQTNANGSIACVDSGEFGPLTINKGVAIVCETVEALITSTTATPAITISAAATDRILIRGLKLQGLQAGTTGIRIIRAGGVFIDDTSVGGFKNGPGISLTPSAAAVPVTIKGVLSTANSIGVLVDSTNAGAGKTTALRIESGDISGNSSAGVRINGTAYPTGVDITSSRVTQNGYGVFVSGGFALARLRNSIISTNQIGLNATGGALLTTTGTNEIQDNVSAGSAPTNVGQQ